MTYTTTVHEGRNVKHFREMLGIKQDALAYELGEDCITNTLPFINGTDKLNRS